MPQRPKYELVPATEELANRVVANMRAEDQAECEALGLSPLEALRQSIAGSRDPLIGLADGEPAAAFGCVSRGALSNTGVPWLLSTEILPLHTRYFLRANRTIIGQWQQEFYRLCNIVDARYVKALDWMRWLGFKELPPIPAGPKRLMFVPFELVK